MLPTNFEYDALNRLTLVTTSQVKDAGGGATYTEYTNRRHRYDALGRVADSALTVWTSGREPTPAYRDHLYAGARHIGNADSGASTYGARWHWAGSQFEHAAPLNSPSADTAGRRGTTSRGRSRRSRRHGRISSKTGGDRARPLRSY